MKKVLMLMTVLALAAGTASAGEMVGWVVDAKCAANGAKEAHAGCAKKCVEAGQPIVLVTDADKKVLKVANQDALKDHVGHKVTVSGKVEGDSITIDSVKM